MVHLSKQIENYVFKYREYVEDIENQIKNCCDNFMMEIKNFKKYVDEIESNRIDQWFNLEEAMRQWLPKAQNIGEFIDEQMYQDSCDITMKAELDDESNEEKQDEWRTSYNLHVACMMEIRYLEIKQDIQGCLKTLLCKHGTKASIGVFSQNWDISYERPTVEEVDKLIEMIDFNLKDKTYDNILEMYNSKKVAYMEPLPF